MTKHATKMSHLAPVIYLLWLQWCISITGRQQTKNHWHRTETAKYTT